MKKRSPFRYFKTSPEIIRLAVMMYVRFPLSLRNVEDLLHERGIDVSHEAVRFWWKRFGPMFAAEIRKNRVSRMRAYSNWQRHLDEIIVTEKLRSFGAAMKVIGFHCRCGMWRMLLHERGIEISHETARFWRT